MASYILSISPKGQITIPVSERRKFKHQKCLLEEKSNCFVLKPIEIKVLEDDLEDFNALAESSFDFWSTNADDVYQNHLDQK
ncbi:hypothetical protein IPG41_05770 [Candidatus Peregrinibacteria bacterium]|nr:MAG: hypothetical protein IPG41_05770 [Candidatus Peregrinibacteria bacterium]